MSTIASGHDVTKGDRDKSKQKLIIYCTWLPRKLKKKWVISRLEITNKENETYWRLSRRKHHELRIIYGDNDMIVQLNRNWWFDLRIKTTSILKTLIGPRSKPVGPCDSDIMSKSNMKGECGQVREKKKRKKSGWKFKICITFNFIHVI